MLVEAFFMRNILFFVIIICVSLFSCNKKKDLVNNYENTENINDITTKTQETIVTKTVDELLVENNLYKINMTANDYNRAGMYFYDKKLWNDAEVMFSKAISLDEYHILANYNLACVLSIQCMLGEYEYSLNAFNILSRSLALDPGRGAKAREDKDLEYLKTRQQEYFDEITLYNYEGRMKKVLSYSGLEERYYPILYFVDGNGRGYYFKDYHNFENIFYAVKEDDWGYIVNTEYLGKKFEIEFFYVFIETQGIEADGLDPPFGFATNEIISIKELK